MSKCLTTENKQPAQSSAALYHVKKLEKKMEIQLKSMQKIEGCIVSKLESRSIDIPNYVRKADTDEYASDSVVDEELIDEIISEAERAIEDMETDVEEAEYEVLDLEGEVEQLERDMLEVKSTLEDNIFYTKDTDLNAWAYDGVTACDIADSGEDYIDHTNAGCREPGEKLYESEHMTNAMDSAIEKWSLDEDIHDKEMELEEKKKELEKLQDLITSKENSIERIRNGCVVLRELKELTDDPEKLKELTDKEDKKAVYDLVLLRQKIKAKQNSVNSIAGRRCELEVYAYLQESSLGAVKEVAEQIPFEVGSTTRIVDVLVTDRERGRHHAHEVKNAKKFTNDMKTQLKHDAIIIHKEEFEACTWHFCRANTITLTEFESVLDQLKSDNVEYTAAFDSIKYCNCAENHGPASQ